MTELTAETLYCANHPQRPTQLRCNKCGKPVCAKCVVRTPVGYRCKECLRAQQQVFETALWYDYVIAGVLAALLAGLAGFFAVLVQFFVVLLAPLAGGVIAEIVRAAVRRRRGRYLTLVATGAFVLGCTPLILLPLLGALFVLLTEGGGGALLGLLWRVLWSLIFCVLGASTVYARLRGISV